MKAFLKMCLHRIRHNWVCRNNKSFCKYLKDRGVKLGDEVNFRYPLSTKIDLTRPTLIEIGNKVDINANFSILTHDFGTFVFRNLYGDFVPSSGKVLIGNNIYFGRDVTILKGVTIGDNCIIGLGSVITKDIPSNSVACGSPCRVICTIEEYYRKRKEAAVVESLDFCQSLINKTGKFPEIFDFTEEWALFLTEQEYNNNQKLKKIIDWRLKYPFSEFRKKHPSKFNGYKDFMAHIAKS